MNNKLREKIYGMSNYFLPLDMFYNDIENMSKYPSFNQASAFKDLEKIADFILDLQLQLKISEKELELVYEEYKQDSTPAKWIYHITKEEYVEHIKTKAKEML